MAGRPSNLRINVTSDSRQARQDVRGLEQDTTGALDKLKTAGPGLAAAAGAAIGAALVAAIGEALAQGKIKGVLNAQLGASGADAKRYGKAAGALYTAGVTEDFQGAADAIRATMQNLVPAAPGEDLEKLATKAQDLATIMGEDVQSTTRAAAQLLKTGLAKNGAEAFDILTKGFQTGANASEDLLDTFTEYSTQFRQLGIDGKTALGLIEQGLAAGAPNADKVADALKELNLRVQNTGDLAAQGALKKLGLDGQEMAEAFAAGGPRAKEALDNITDALRQYKGTTEGTTLATALLGTQSEDLQKALFAMDPSTASAVKGLDDLKGSSDGVATSLRDNAGAQLTAFQRKLQQSVVDFIGEKVLPVLVDLHHWYQDEIAPAVSSLADLYVQYATPAIADARKGILKIIDAYKDNKTEIDDVIDVVKLLVKNYGTFATTIMGVVLQAIVNLINSIGTLVRWLKTAYGWVTDLIGALGKIKIPSALRNLGSLAGGILFSSAASDPSVSPQPFAARALAAPPMSSVQAFSSYMQDRDQPLVLNITIDGQQLQGRISRTVTSALNMEGAILSSGRFV